ncbi:DNA repair protein RecN [Actinopolymorpha rutila]|uniref:DNA repair protein RecN n=1 Tax=Actinopolymorpha rutila TaxID=446787 RepID=A0A852ZAU7_9ACTN|nr:DNA repair protein RecN [Actinopolymorpha rutila]NYH90317.1 DNA repair protein RecN (Recombination protein N) [Actinopolymorpha rutila]
MLEEIRIHGLGVIDDAVLDLDAGLTVVTGETGAGKTMVVTGLSLLLGGRADAGLVRRQTERAVVEGRLRLDSGSAAARRAVEAGAQLEDDTLIVMRTIARDGRSRAYAGGAGVPAGVLAELAEELVALHGQSDQLRLLRPSRQREILDRYAGSAVQEPLAAYRIRYSRLAEVDAELSSLVARARDRAQEADLLRFGLAEIESADPQPGEDKALTVEEDRLAHADSLRAAASLAQTALTGDEDLAGAPVDALSQVASARKALDTAGMHDPELAGVADRLAEAAALLADAGSDLASYAAGVDTDPARLQAIGDRRAVLGALTRKYGETIDDVLAWARRSAIRLAELDGSDDTIGALRAERQELTTELGMLAHEVSSARMAAAERLGSAVTAELGDLAMPHAELTADVAQTEVRTAEVSEPASAGERKPNRGRRVESAHPDTATTAGHGTGGETEDQRALLVDGRWLAYGAHGVDEVELRLRPHPGAPARAVQRGASGGELSRVMLAVEVVFAGVDGVPTFVFDEVDAGVGGRAAVEIGRRLARLAANSQVVVVTHLPQVAAFADRHYVVRKSDDGSVTRSGLTWLDDEGRVAELARMLAGLDGSASARAHAEELLATAAEARRDAAGSRSGRKKAVAAAAGRKAATATTGERTSPVAPRNAASAKSAKAVREDSKDAAVVGGDPEEPIKQSAKASTKEPRSAAKAVRGNTKDAKLDEDAASSKARKATKPARSRGGSS